MSPTSTTTTPSNRLCRGCDKPIHAKRLEALPHTPWCLSCAETRVERMGGNMIWSHKTAPELELKPLSEAQTFHKRYDRKRANACIGVGSITQAMDRAAGINPFTKE